MNIEILRLFRDARLWKGPALGVIVLLLAANVAVFHWTPLLNAPVGARRIEQGATALDFIKENRPVRFDWSIGDQLDHYEKFIPDARKNKLVILSGMSQMYTINQYHRGDETIAELMDDALAPKGTRVFGLAAPNLSHEEALFLLMTTLQKPETKPSAFVFAVSFEKLREFDLRPHYQSYLIAHPEVAAAYRAVAMRYRKKYPLATKKMLATLDEIQTTVAPEKSSVETSLRTAAASFLPLVAERQNINGHVQTTIFNFRNELFGITNMTKRPIIPERYDTNREFLGLITDLAHENGIDVMLYICPFNPRADNPYIPSEYAAFKQWMAEFCHEKNVPMANLENAVPIDDWGTFFGGPDFKHFKEAGHRRTAAALLSAFGSELLPSDRQYAMGGSR